MKKKLLEKAVAPDKGKRGFRTKQVKGTKKKTGSSVVGEGVWREREALVSIKGF